MNVDFDKFQGSLPYASELFGIYQPLLGWRARRIKRRFRRVGEDARRQLISYIASKAIPDVRLAGGSAAKSLQEIRVGALVPGQRSTVSGPLDSLVAGTVLAQMQQSGADIHDDSAWAKALSQNALNSALKTVHKQIISGATLPAAADGSIDPAALRKAASTNALASANKESSVAATLNYLAENKRFDDLRAMFFPAPSVLDLAAFADIVSFVDPLEHFDPTADIGLVALSPVGIIHMFQQYFFEFDTFVGTPVQHVWLSPNGTVEMIEVATRRMTTERYTESAIESVVKTEKSLTTQDDLSDAIKSDNQSNTKFGVSTTTSAGVNMGVYSASAGVNTNYGFDSSQKSARETVHKQNRQQSSKLTAEIKDNFKSSFKTTIEVNDTTSKRYVLQNTSGELVNYELRRKMRQVGVQLQDMGTQLCWQTYVDAPGDDLGIAKLVHIAQPADLSNLKQPDAPTLLQMQVIDAQVPFAYESPSQSDERDETYYSGSDGDWPSADTIVWLRSYHADPPDHGYTLDPHISVEPQCDGICAAVPKVLNAKGDYQIRLDQVNFGGKSSIMMKVTLRWNPPDQSAALLKFKADQEQYHRDKERLTKAAYVQAAHDRIKLASNISPRDSMTLREEERIVVYRKLIGDLLHVGVNLADAPTRHITAELVSSIFSVDQMLYFVAPEWWRPRMHESSQTFGSANAEGESSTSTPITSENVVSWGGVNDGRKDNYWITEDSVPARLGSSLGWLLQLDGDDLRNAFVNAPWVKAVIPIRPGKELAALNWLAHASVEGVDGLDAQYQAASAEEVQSIVAALLAHSWTDPNDQLRYGPSFGTGDVTVRDALRYLAIAVADKSNKANDLQTETVGNAVKSYLPTDLVYEHGFSPLQGGFKAAPKTPYEVFDQWIEVLPTDQIVAVQVKYDPKTGMQV